MTKQILNYDGLIDWDEKRLSRQYSKSTFDNSMCIKCVYLPLCWGPCPQKLIDTKEEDLSSICFLSSFEYPVSKLIIDKYENTLINKQTQA